MNILVVSSYLPHPLFSGGDTRLFNLLKILGKEHKITLVCEKRSFQTKQDIFELEQLCQNVITVPRVKQWSINNILKTGLSDNSFLITGHTSQPMRDAITSILFTQKIDLIHVETSYVLQNIPATKVPLLLVEHNIEYLVYQRYLDKASKLIRPLLQIDVNKLKRFEQHAWRRATRVATVSPQEKDIIQKLKSDVSVVPNGVDLDTFAMKHVPSFLKTANEKRLLFIGDFNWIQNRDAVTWLIFKVWPLLRKRLADENLKLWIVGRHIPNSIKKMSDINIISTESAPDASEVFRHSYLLLAPIRVGGGTSYKILESMASGTPVITTGLGVEGILAERGKDILVGDDPLEIADLVENIVKDNKFYIKVAVNAREKIEQNYSWVSIAKQLNKIYQLTTVTKK